MKGERPRQASFLFLLSSSLLFLLHCSTSNQNDIDNSSSDGGKACLTCHGSEENSAPPFDVSGNDSTSERGVGAHQSHLVASDLFSAVPCKECHLVPEEIDSEGHLDDLPAEVVFGSLSSTGGLKPQWNGATCAGTYCHGSNLAGGTNTEPNWTLVNGLEVECGSCHGTPPPSPHVQSNQCEICHSTAGESLSIATAETHADGIVQVIDNLKCNACHGSNANDAPPMDLAGKSSTSRRSIGAHQVHLTAASGLSVAVACNECHVVPSEVSSTGHIDDDLPAEVIFGTIAQTGGALPLWNGTTCAGSYCHNPEPTDSGASDTEPNWTTVDGSQLQCDSCHGFPPSGHNPAWTGCQGCHPATVAGPNPMTITSPAKHLNGLINFGS